MYIHDCVIWNQDDCISVKDGSQDMLFERITCSGLGLVIGSIGSSMVKNITFRHSYMPNTVKGIYMKTRWNDAAPIGEAASISDIYYYNITIDNPEQYGIWIGPAQQTGQPCSLLWTKAKQATCSMSGYQVIIINTFFHLWPVFSLSFYFRHGATSSYVIFSLTILSRVLEFCSVIPQILCKMWCSTMSS